LSIDYLKYETVIDLKLVDPDFNYNPTITLCIDSKNLYHSERTENTIISHDFGNLICDLRFLYGPKSQTNCKNFSHILESYTPLGDKCITLFSALIEKKIPIKKLYLIYIDSYSVIKLFALIHQDISPPYLYTNKFEFGKWGKIRIEYTSIIESLLPFPYETNCYDYGIGTKTSRSKDDCIVNYYRRKEYENELMWTYLEKLIADLKFEELQQISFTKNFIKSCKLFRNRQTIDCSNSRNGLLKSANFHEFYDYLTFHPILDNNSKSLYECNTCNDENIDRIELTLNRSVNVFIFWGDCKSVYYGSEFFTIDKNTITQIGFTSYSMENFGNGCLKNENYSIEKFYQNCYFLNYNQTYG
jgi:hypothetical protein